MYFEILIENLKVIEGSFSFKSIQSVPRYLILKQNSDKKKLIVTSSLKFLLEDFFYRPYF